MVSISRVLAACWLSWLLNFSYRMFVPTILPALKDELKLSDFLCSLLLTCLLAGYSLAVALSGLLAFKFGRRRTIGLSLMVSSLSSFLVPFSSSLPVLAFLLFIAGVGLGLYLPSALSLLSDLSEPRHRGKIIGIHETAAPTGQVLGPMVAWFLLSQGYTWRQCAIIWPPLLLTLSLPFLTSGPEPSLKRIHGRSIPIPLEFYLLALATYLCMTSGTGLISMVPLYLSVSFGLSAAAAAFIVGFSRITGILGQLVGGHLSDKLGRRRLLAASVVLTAGSTLAFSLLPYGTPLIGTLLLMAASHNAFFPVFFAFLSDVTPSSERSMMFSVMLAPGAVMGAGVTPFIMGWLADSYGYTIALAYPTSLALLAIPLVIFVTQSLKAHFRA